MATQECPCGHLGDTGRECTCNPYAIQRYLSRISGPILDRIDIHVEVPAIHFRELACDSGDGENSSNVRQRVNRAREIQKKRYNGMKNVHANAHIGPRAIRQFCGVDDDGKRIFQRAMEAFGFSARVYHRILKVSRTIADLAGEEGITARHIAEAVQYRTLDRKIWNF
jgi:magnesium chelatase family protein